MTEVDTETDTLDFASLTPMVVQHACDAAIARCVVLLDDLVAIPDAERSHANTVEAFDAALELLSDAEGYYGLSALVGPTEALREAASDATDRLHRANTDAFLRHDVYAAIQSYSERHPASDASEQRFLSLVLGEYRRRGAALPAAGLDRARTLFGDLSTIGSAFLLNVAEWDDSILVTLDDLQGMPETRIAGLHTVEAAEGLRYRISITGPEYATFMATASSGSLRRDLCEKHEHAGGPSNVVLLDQALAKRRDLAGLLGYDSWAAYQIEPAMAGTPDRVSTFLSDLDDALRPGLASEIAQLEGAIGEPIVPWNGSHAARLFRQGRNDPLDTIYEYLPLNSCLQGLFGISESLFGITITAASDAPVWHEDVRAFDVHDHDTSELLGRFYIDLLTRPGKYGHAFVHQMRIGNRRGYVRRTPVCALITNSASVTPALLSHDALITLFHEFGHVLHEVLTQARYSYLGGRRIQHDAIEAPSQIMEHWARHPQILSRFARHHDTGAPLPREMVDALGKDRSFGSAMALLRDAYFSVVDQAYYAPGTATDSSALGAEVHQAMGLPHLGMSHWQGSWIHQFQGYDGRYYGYLWAQVIGDDLFSRFERDGVLNPTVGRAYRSLVLEPGGTVDGNAFAHAFLGRPVNQDAFLRNHLPTD